MAGDGFAERVRQDVLDTPGQVRHLVAEQHDLLDRPTLEWGRGGRGHEEAVRGTRGRPSRRVRSNTPKRCQASSLRDPAASMRVRSPNVSVTTRLVTETSAPTGTATGVMNQSSA